MLGASWTDEDLVEEYPLGNGQRGIRARTHIPANTIIGAYGGEVRLYKVVDGRIADPDAASQVIQIAVAGSTVLGLVTPGGARFYGIDFINHDCRSPTVIVENQIVLKTARDVAAGEPLTADYRTWDYVPYGIPGQPNCWCDPPQCVI